MSDHRRVGVVFAWQVMLFAAVTLSCSRTEEFEPAGVQPGCAVGLSGELTSGIDSTRLLRLPPEHPDPPNRTSCDTVRPTTLDLLVMYEAALLRNNTQEAIEGWIEQKVDEANTIFANSGARRIKYELRAIRPVSARLPDTTAGTVDHPRVRILEILDDWIRDGNSIMRRYREAYGADMAIFIAAPFTDNANGTRGDVCGIGTLPVLDANRREIHARTPGGDSQPPRLFGDEAFAVIEYRCGESDFTFAHELGHTLGMNHGMNGQAVLSYAQGARLTNAGSPLATVMSCGGDSFPDDQVPLGVCNRIPHFSSPDRTYSIRGCTQEPCRVVTGTVNTDNARVACERAPMYAAFRARPRNEPPTVTIRSVQEVAPDGTLRPVGSEVSSGTIVVITALATDRQDRDLSASIQWIDQRGEIIGAGESLTVQLLQSGDSPISARVTDSGGLVDEWAVPLRVTWPPDAFEVHDASSAEYSVIPFNTHQDRNFHAPGDVDRVMSVVPANPGDTIRVRLVPLGERAAPLMEVELWQANRPGGAAVSLGSGITGELQHTLSAGQTGNVRVRIRNAGDAAGIGTDYQVHLERTEPQRSISPRVGPWGNPARSGHGIDLQRTSDGQYVAAWYTYRTDGSPISYLSEVAPIQGTLWRSPLYVSTWNGVTNTLEIVGTLEMSFSSDTSATLSWSFPATGVQGSEPFTFYVFDVGATGVANGLWYPPSESGWGISLWHQGNVGVITIGTYDAFGQPTWAQARADGDPSDWGFAELYQYTAPGLCPSCDGSLPVTLHRNVGTAHFWLWDPVTGTGALTVHLNNAAAIGEWHRDGIPFARLTAGNFGLVRNFLPWASKGGK